MILLDAELQYSYLRTMADADLIRTFTQRLLSQDPTLSTLTLANRPCVPTSVLDALAQSAHVRVAHFELTGWGDEQCFQFERSGAPSPMLESLFLTHNSITSAGLPPLCKAILRGRLTLLNLSCNPLGAELAPLGQAVACSRVSVLNLNDTQQHAEGLVAFADGLKSGANRPNTLHLQGNGIDDEVRGGAKSMDTALPDRPHAHNETRAAFAWHPRDVATHAHTQLILPGMRTSTHCEKPVQPTVCRIDVTGGLADRSPSVARDPALPRQE